MDTLSAGRGPRAAGDDHRAGRPEARRSRIRPDGRPVCGTTRQDGCLMSRDIRHATDHPAARPCHHTDPRSPPTTVRAAHLRHRCPTRSRCTALRLGSGRRRCLVEAGRRMCPRRYGSRRRLLSPLGEPTGQGN